MMFLPMDSIQLYCQPMGGTVVVALLAYGLGSWERYFVGKTLRGSLSRGHRFSHFFKYSHCLHGLGLLSILQTIIFLCVWIPFHRVDFLAWLTLFSLSLCGARLDWARRIIPDEISFYGILLGFGFLLAGTGAPGATHVLFSNPHGTLLANGAMDVLLTSGTLLWIALIFEFFTGKDGLGLGDVKFAGMMGLYLGWMGALHAIVYGAWSALLWILLRKFFSPGSIHNRHPFIPHLAVGILIHVCRQIFFFSA
jgi:leader peptidase (prepilin peptidase)/N-methyltransferase